MIISAETFQILLDMGAPSEKVAAFLHALDKDMAAFAAPAERSTRQDRNARYYEKQRLKRLNSDELDVSDARVSPKEIPPTPPKEITPSQPTTSKPNGLSVVATASRLKTRRCPEAYLPGPRVTDVADALGFTSGDLERELAKFKDHQFRDAHTDWDAAFRNWIRRAAEQNPRKADGHSPKFQARQANLDRSANGFENATRYLAQRRDAVGDA